MINSTMKIFSGTSNPGLAEEIANYLGIKLSNIELGKFKDGEISAR